MRRFVVAFGLSAAILAGIGSAHAQIIPGVSATIPCPSLPMVPAFPLSLPPLNLPNPNGLLPLPNLSVPTLSLSGLPTVPSLALPVPTLSLAGLPGLPGYAIPTLNVPRLPVPNMVLPTTQIQNQLSNLQAQLQMALANLGTLPAMSLNCQGMCCS